MGADYEDKQLHYMNTVWIIGFIIINISTVFSRESHNITYFNLNSIIQRETNETNSLLNSMLP